MHYRPVLAILTVALFSAVIALIFLMGLIPMTELFIAVLGALIPAIIAVCWWGFKDKIEDTKESTDFYSPIHAMIVRANNKVPRDKALQLTVGAWLSVKELGIDHQTVSEAFNLNINKFKDDDLKKWVTIEEQIKAYVNGGGFFIGRDVQEWFDDLERRFNH